MSNTIDQIIKKYQELGENPETYLEGLLHADPITYWDYVEVDTLLSLQKPRTPFKDEVIFILYHQVTELLLKMIRHELEQLVDRDIIDKNQVTVKIGRCIRYTEMLISSFDIMKDGMDPGEYQKFRKTLTPASGFQSAQFRYIEILCTPLENLINEEGRQRLPQNPSVEEYFDHIYWKDAGYDRSTGKKTLTLQRFEEKYLEDFITLAKKVQGRTLGDKIGQMGDRSSLLVETLKKFDYLYNVEWPMVHLRTAAHYLEGKSGQIAATGGSKWKKYLHPSHQQRKFFPALWTETEKEQWGEPKTVDHGNKEQTTSTYHSRRQDL